MKRQHKFCPSVNGLEQRLNLNAAVVHVGDLAASVAQTAVVAAKSHHATHHTPVAHHSGTHGKGHAKIASPVDLKTKHHKVTHHSGTHGKGHAKLASPVDLKKQHHKPKPHKHVSHKHH
jgi:hypothetical protein